MVKPVNDVMSELAPEAAAPRLERAVAAVVAAVPPLATETGVEILLPDDPLDAEVILPSAPTVTVAFV